MNREFIIPRRRRRIRPYLDLTAVIDVVFNLLIFFAVASTVVGARSGLPLRLPSAVTAQPVPERVVVTLQPGQPIQVDGREVASGKIGPALHTATDGDLDAQVVVLADRDVPYSQLVAALDEVRLADYHRIALAASPRPTDEEELPEVASVPVPPS
jgi:biopolymer transport protein ExbD